MGDFSFERGRTGINLTSEGLKLLPQLKRICNEYEILMKQIGDLHNLESGIIRIGTFSSVASHWLPNILNIFKKDYPMIDFEFLLGDYTEIESWILNGRVDFGFVRLPTTAELETVFLEQDRLLVVIPHDHPLSNCEKFPINGLLNSPFMLLKRERKQRFPKFLRDTKSHRMLILQHGMTMPLCLWWKMGWESVYYQN